MKDFLRLVMCFDFFDLTRAEILQKIEFAFWEIGSQEKLLLRLTNPLILYFFTHENKTVSTVGYFSKIAKWPNLPNDSKIERLVRGFIALEIYNIGCETQS